MWTRNVVGAILLAFVFAKTASAQPPATADFGRDVQPILKEHCIGCHGPSQQMNGLRLDQRSSAIKVGTRRVVPGSSANSFVYLKLVGSEYGIQMPPTGPLRPEQINMIKAWIDQGAEWPDDLAGDAPPPPPDPGATRIMDALRKGDRRIVRRLLNENPKIANLKGSGGATPLMYAALYGDAESVRLLLDGGADPNIKNQAGATALMWAVDDAEKIRLLLDHGADANARSEEGRTPLIIAAHQLGSSAVVKLLLDRGANPSARSVGGDTPLQQAAYAGDEAVLRMLTDRGADVKASASYALFFAMRANCAKCIEMLIESVDREGLNVALVALAPFGDITNVKILLDRGADVNATRSGVRRDLDGRTPLLLAASSDLLPVDTVKVLIDRGADIHAKGPSGETALDLAKRNGDTAVVELLMRSGAKEGGAFRQFAVTPKPATSARAALQRSIPLLQRSDVASKAGCVSCHNDSFTAMTVAIARENRLPIDDQIARKHLKTIASFIDGQRETVLQGNGLPEIASSILVGLAAENHPPDVATDAMAYFLKTQQWPDGRWRTFFLDHRPPIQASDITLTAASIRALRFYAPKSRRAEYEKTIRRAVDWLMQAQPKTTDERALQILGLKWAGVNANNQIIRKAGHDLLAEQRSDGGWGQLVSLASDAYATGQALLALKEAAAVRITDAAYKRGVQFLLNTQLEDGSWYVKSRSIPFQPYFESGFPHGSDQWISAAATNWASMALALAAR